MAAKEFDISLEQKHFVSPQGAITTSATEAATDAFKALPQSDVDSQGTLVMLKRNDNKPGRDELEKVDGKEGPYPWSVTTNIVPSGTAGTSPDVAAFYDAMMIESNTEAFTPDAAQSTNGCTTSDVGKVSAGEVIVIPHPTSGEPAEAVYVTAVNTVSSQDVITWWPNLSFTPGPANEIKICTQLTPRNGVATDKYFTYRRYLSSMIQALGGCLPDTLEVSFKDGEFVEQTISGMARHAFGNGQTTLDGGIVVDATTIKVNDIDVFYGIDSNHTAKATIEAEGGNSVEDIVITGIDLDNDQITVASVSSDHGDGAQIIPDFESETTAGSPIAGVSGKLFFDDETAELSVLNADFAFAENFKWRTEFGDAKSPGAVAAADRTVTGTVNLTGKGSDWVQAGLGESRSSGPMLIYAGSVVGAVFGIMLPLAYFKAKVENGGDGEEDKITLTLDRALGADGDDSFVIFYG